jgi:hypothetical protein
MSNIVRLAKEFVIKYRGTIIARCRDFSITVGKNTVDITSFDSDGWEEFIGDLKNWNISFSSMMLRPPEGVYWNPTGATEGSAFAPPKGVFEGLFDFMVATSAAIASASNYGATVILGDDSTGYAASASFYEGFGILNNLSADGAVGDIISYSGEIQGAGKLTRKRKKA